MPFGYCNVQGRKIYHYYPVSTSSKCIHGNYELAISTIDYAFLLLLKLQQKGLMKKY